MEGLNGNLAADVSRKIGMDSSGNIVWADSVLAIAAQHMDQGADAPTALDVAIHTLSRKTDTPKKSPRRSNAWYSRFRHKAKLRIVVRKIRAA